MAKVRHFFQTFVTNFLMNNERWLKYLVKVIGANFFHLNIYPFIKIFAIFRLILIAKYHIFVITLIGQSIRPFILDFSLTSTRWPRKP